LVVEFDRPDQLVEAAKRARQAGYTRLDAFSPFPLLELNDILALRKPFIPYIPLVAAAIGGAVQYYAQYWMNAVDYPINVGGRPLHSWPAFIPSAIIVALLWAGIATFVTFLAGTKLPQLHHPVFDIPDFERASQDRFFLWITADDPCFDHEQTLRFLETLSPKALREVSG
jgi:hypothetical protein